MTPDQFDLQSRIKQGQVYHEYRKAYEAIEELKEEECDCDRAACGRCLQIQQLESRLSSLRVQYTV